MINKLIKNLEFLCNTKTLYIRLIIGNNQSIFNSISGKGIRIEVVTEGQLVPEQINRKIVQLPKVNNITLFLLYRE